MPRMPLPPELVEFLATPHAAVVATIRPDGSPHTAATWYEWRDGLVLLNMDRTRLRLEYLRRDPRCSLTVLDTGDWYRVVTLMGQVVRIEEDEGLAGIDSLSQHYRGGPYWNRDSTRYNAWLQPERWHEHGILAEAMPSR